MYAEFRFTIPANCTKSAKQSRSKTAASNKISILHCLLADLNLLFKSKSFSLKHAPEISSLPQPSGKCICNCQCHRMNPSGYFTCHFPRTSLSVSLRSFRNGRDGRGVAESFWFGLKAGEKRLSEWLRPGEFNHRCGKKLCIWLPSLCFPLYLLFYVSYVWYFLFLG